MEQTEMLVSLNTTPSGQNFAADASRVQVLQVNISGLLVRACYHQSVCFGCVKMLRLGC